MTAQRTTLLSFCLLLITIAAHIGDVSKIKLLATNIEVSSGYALKMMIIIVFVSSASYFTRFWAEYKPTEGDGDSQRLKNLMRDAKK